jgi:hypothetical protein
MIHWPTMNEAEQWLEDTSIQPVLSANDKMAFTINHGPGRQEYASSLMIIRHALMNMITDHKKTGNPIIFEPVWSPSQDSLMHQPEWWSDERSIITSNIQKDLIAYSGGLEHLAEWSEGLNDQHELMHKMVSVGLYDLIRTKTIDWKTLRHHGVKRCYANAWSAHMTKNNGQWLVQGSSSLSWLGSKPTAIMSAYDQQERDAIIAIPDARHHEASDKTVITTGKSSRSLIKLLTDIESLSYNIRLDDHCRLRLVIAF